MQVVVLVAAGVVSVVVVHFVLDAPLKHVVVLILWAKTVLDNEGASTSVAAATTTNAKIIFVCIFILNFGTIKRY